LVKNIDFSIFC